MSPSRHREALRGRFADRIRVDAKLDRTLVSFQGNRRVPFARWFRYKEGFSEGWVRDVLSTTPQKRGFLLDPFAGVGTAPFVAAGRGWDAIGIELLPVGRAVVEARQAARQVDRKVFERWVDRISTMDWCSRSSHKYAFPHLPITKGAFPPETELAISGYRAFCRRAVKDPLVRGLLEFACLCILEEVSYTRKDGQYLRWDRRADRARGSKAFHKGRIPSFSEAIARQLRRMCGDMLTDGSEQLLFEDSACREGVPGRCDWRVGSCLRELPRFSDHSVDLVVTSPPYCNRYDYTRTYALELAFLGVDAAGLKDLRQQMLSCTVENREKIDEIEDLYIQAGKNDVPGKVRNVFEGQGALQEVLDILEDYRDRDLLNNVNVPKMVRNYFLEMCFVVYELARVLRPGGRVVMVNDNVRYGGQEVPVDLILSDFAESFGLCASRILCLPRGKGNSSQQMGHHGRSELRKCVYVWEKPKRPTR